MKVAITSLMIALCVGGSFFLCSIVHSQVYTSANEIEAKDTPAIRQEALNGGVGQSKGYKSRDNQSEMANLERKEAW